MLGSLLGCILSACIRRFRSILNPSLMGRLSSSIVSVWFLISVCLSFVFCMLFLHRGVCNVEERVRPILNPALMGRLSSSILSLWWVVSVCLSCVLFCRSGVFAMEEEFGSSVSSSSSSTASHKSN